MKQWEATNGSDNLDAGPKSLLLSSTTAFRRRKKKNTASNQGGAAVRGDGEWSAGVEADGVSASDGCAQRSDGGFNPSRRWWGRRASTSVDGSVRCRVLSEPNRHFTGHSPHPICPSTVAGNFILVVIKKRILIKLFQLSRNFRLISWLQVGYT